MAPWYSYRLCVALFVNSSAMLIAGCARDNRLNRYDVSTSEAMDTGARDSSYEVYTGAVLGVNFVKTTIPTPDPNNDGGLCLQRCGFANNPRDYSFEVALTSDGKVSVKDGSPASRRFERALTEDELTRYLELRYAGPLNGLAAARDLTDTSTFCPPSDASKAQWYGAGLAAVNAQGFVVGFGPIETCFRDLAAPTNAEQQALMALTEWLRQLGRNVVGGCADFGETLADGGVPVSAPEVLNICKFRWDVESAWQ